MKRYRGIIPRRRLNAINSALFANVLNVVMILILRGIQSLLPNTGTYNVAYGIVEIAVMAAFWFIYTYRLFSTSTEDNRKLFLQYLVLMILPMVIYTGICCAVLIATANNASFMRTWNGFTFGVAPALFLYLPYGLIYHFLPDTLSILVFFAIDLVLIVAVQAIGYVIGKHKLTSDEAKERKRKALEDKLEAEEKEAAAKGAAQPESRPQPAMAKKTPVTTRRRRPARPAKDDVFSDVENKAIVETEAFTPITDEMIEEVMREERKKQREDAQQARKARSTQTRHSKRGKKEADNPDGVDPKNPKNH